MLFIKRCHFVLCIFMVALLSACSPMKSKNDGENITPLDQAEMQTTTDYAEQYEEGQEQEPLEQDGDAYTEQTASADPYAAGYATADVIEPDLSLEERFGINPYLASPPMVTPDAQAAFEEAMSAVRAEDTETAIVLLQQMTVDYPELSGPAYNLAVIYYQQDKPKESLQAIEQALVANENNFDARNLQGKIYRDNSEFTKAEEAYLEIINRWGGYLPAYKNLGIMFDLYMGQQERALKYYQLYNKYSPDEDRQVIGWQMVIERQIKAQEMQQQAVEQQAEAQQALDNPEQTEGDVPSDADVDQDADAAIDATDANVDTDAGIDDADSDAQSDEALNDPDSDMQDQEVQP